MKTLYYFYNFSLSSKLLQNEKLKLCKLKEGTLGSKGIQSFGGLIPTCIKVSGLKQIHDIDIVCDPGKLECNEDMMGNLWAYCV